MELEVSKGNYCPDEDGGLRYVQGYQETIQRIMMRLQARRGMFYPLPDFGSRLYTLPGIKAGERHAAARQFVHEALEKENVRILQLQCEDREDSLIIRLWLDISGRETELSLRV